MINKKVIKKLKEIPKYAARTTAIYLTWAQVTPGAPQVKRLVTRLSPRLGN
jgi:hypothetical protein